MDLTSSPIPTEDLPWMPLGPGIAARPLWFGRRIFAVVVQLKVEPGVSVGRHKHTGAVHAFNVPGSRELGNGEIAGPGAYVYEPAGNADDWRCVGDEPCIIQITLSGRVIYVDDDGKATERHGQCEASTAISRLVPGNGHRSHGARRVMIMRFLAWLPLLLLAAACGQRT